MPSFIPSWEEIQELLNGIGFGDVVTAIIANIIFFSFIVAWKTFRAYIKDWRANRLENLEKRRANRLRILEERLKRYKTMKERPAKHFAALNVFGFFFLTFLIIRVNSSDLGLSASATIVISIIMIYAFARFIRFALLLVDPELLIERTKRKIAKKKSTSNSDH